MVWAACLPAAPQALRLLQPVAQPLLLQVAQQQQRLKAQARLWRKLPNAPPMSRGWCSEKWSPNGSPPPTAPLVSAQDECLEEASARVLCPAAIQTPPPAAAESSRPHCCEAALPTSHCTAAGLLVGLSQAPLLRRGPCDALSSGAAAALRDAIESEGTPLWGRCRIHPQGKPQGRGHRRAASQALAAELLEAESSGPVC